MSKRIVKLFSTLETYYEDSNKLIDILYYFCMLFKKYQTKTIDKISKFHIKLYCYLLGIYSPNGVDEISEDDLKIIFFLIVIHVIEEDYDYGIGLIGNDKTERLIYINDLLYSDIFKVNLDNCIVTDFWNELNKRNI